MSNLSNKTEKKALHVLARCVVTLEKLYYLDMTATDDFDVTQAKNLMTGIIQSNGYKINYGNSRSMIVKDKSQSNHLNGEPAEPQLLTL